jgi:indolepyruvate ferredoxin oxidoreductase
MVKAFGVLAALKALRPTPLNPFGYSAERRMERRLLAEYEADIDLLTRRLSAESLDAAVALASVPVLIRGYGHVKEASVRKAEGERERLRTRLSAPVEGPALQAAE